MNIVQTILLEMDAASKEISETLGLIRSLLKEKLPSQRDYPILVVLPENFLFYSSNPKRILNFASSKELDEIILGLSIIASEFKVWLVAGTLPVQETNHNIYIESLCFSASGLEIGRYRKQHLFKAKVNDTFYDEGLVYTPGNECLLFAIGKMRFCIAVCFDLRFPKMFATMRRMGADVFIVPAAFTVETGSMVWESLLRARAIENQCYVLGCGLSGVGENGCESWGHSLVAAPNGEIIAKSKNGIVSADLSVEKILSIRKSMPMESY